MRVSDYLGTAVRNIANRPVRCLLTICSIVLSSALLVTLVSLGVTMRGAVIEHITRGNTLSTVIVSADPNAGGGFFSPRVREEQKATQKLTDEALQTLKSLPQVVSAAPQVSMAQLRSLQLEGSDTSYLATAIATSEQAIQETTLAAGQWFDNDTTEPVVVLGSAYLRALKIKDPASVVGKRLTFTTTAGYRGVGAEIPAWDADPLTAAAFTQKKSELTATIIGVTTPSTNDNRTYLPMGWGRLIHTPRTSTPEGETTNDMLSQTGYSTIVVTTETPDAVTPVANRIAALGFGTITYEEQIAQINQLARVMWMVLGSVALISVISASLGIINTLLMSVSEQKQTIRIWRASGASQGLISRLYVLEAVVLSLIGSAIGAAAGAFAYRIIADRIEIVLSSQGLGILQLADVPAWILGGSIAASVGLAVAASLYPAYVAARRISAS